MNVKILLGFCC